MVWELRVWKIQLKFLTIYFVRFDCVYSHPKQSEPSHSNITNLNPLTGVQVFAPMQHIKSGACPVNSYSRDNFTIIGREANPYMLLVKESIFISTSKPNLNNNKTSVPIYLFSPYWITRIFWIFVIVYLKFVMLLYDGSLCLGWL